MFSPLPLRAGLKCGLVNGHIECGHANGGGKHHDDDDDQKGNEDDHQKKKKNNDDDTGLESCTIQPSNGGGGCVSPYKHVCEKLKSGKKCCGCVLPAGATPPKPVEHYYECQAALKEGGFYTYSNHGPNEAAVRQEYLESVVERKYVLTSPVTCKDIGVGK